MRIALVTDAWSPQVNGVVRTLTTTVAALRARGHIVTTVTPDRFRTVPLPTYPEIRLALFAGRSVGRLIEGAQADAVHIATEGPLGHAARAHCLARGRPFTTSFHTRFPDYVRARFGVPERLVWPLVRRFHTPARHVLAATPRLADELADRGFPRVRLWSRGVDLGQFKPDLPAPDAYAGLARPIQLCVGRVAVEKNIEAFLAAPAPGTKVVVGDGPATEALRRRFPTALFMGALHGEALARAYAGADVFVFPSLTDTFGLVMIEALASGLPVAAYPTHGPLDVVTPATGALDDDLGIATLRALTLSPAACVAHAATFAWDACVDQFEGALVAG